jgi:hypothetical protein
MKTKEQILNTFSLDEIKILVDIIKGDKDFDVMGDVLIDFYQDELDDYYLNQVYDDHNIMSEDEALVNDLLEKLQFDLEAGGLI